MVGVDGALALGLHRTHGWRIVTLAGFAAASPDWDGVALLAGAALFDQAHRVWGHNVFACVLAGIAIARLDWRYDLIGRMGRKLVGWLRLSVANEHLAPRADLIWRGKAVWLFTAVTAALSHLPADIVVSGGRRYGDWPVQILWPISERGWVDPRVPWGDVGITLIFIAGAAAMLWRPRRMRLIAALALGAVASYISFRPMLFGMQ